MLCTEMNDASKDRRDANAIIKLLLSLEQLYDCVSLESSGIGGSDVEWFLIADNFAS